MSIVVKEIKECVCGNIRLENTEPESKRKRKKRKNKTSRSKSPDESDTFVSDTSIQMDATSFEKGFINKVSLQQTIEEKTLPP